MNLFNNILLLFITLLNILLFKNGSVMAIVGGADSILEEFKYHASIIINNKLACGGCIISNELILTAAQCIMDKNGQFLNVKLSVIAGVSNFNSNPGNMFIRDVIKAYVPYEFRNEQDEAILKDPHYLESGDIAVLQLRTALPLDTSPLLDNLVVPLKKNKKSEKYMYRKGNITGFGLNTPVRFKSASDLQNLGTRLNKDKKLKYAETIIQRKTSCDAIYHKFKNSHLCASIKEPTHAGTCHGDIGGPLVLDKVTIVGVLVRYRNNCQEIDAALYTRVSYYIDFLNNIRDVGIPSNIRVATYENSNVLEIIPTERMSDLVSSS